MNFNFFSKKQHDDIYSFGIDFGTTNTKLCIYDNSKMTILEDEILSIPSLATSYFSKDENQQEKYEWEIGENVKEKFWDYYSNVKLHLGTSNELSLKTDLNKISISLRPEVITSKILWEIKNKFCKNTNYIRNIHNIIITIPNEWNAINRQATIFSAKIAGFKNIFLLEEPVAAYIGAVNHYINSSNLSSSKYTLIFDYGGGTLDISIIHKPNKEIPYVIGKAFSKINIGGEHIDNLLTKKLINKLDLTLENISNIDFKRITQIVKKIKEQLNPNLPNSIPGGIFHDSDFIMNDSSNTIIEKEKIIISFDELQEVMNPVLNDIEEMINSAISNAHLKKEEIDSILLVGGSSKLRILQNKIEDIFSPKKINKDIFIINPEHLVAIGASIYSGSIFNKKRKTFRIKSPMDTFLEYENEDHLIKTYQLDKINNGYLPIKSKILKIKVPKNHIDINWKIKQKYNYGNIDNEIIIEKISIKKSKDFWDWIRLQYVIDLNGLLVDFQPLLVFHQSKKIELSPKNIYDWNNENPTEIAMKYNIREE